MFRRINFFFWLISIFGSMAALYCLIILDSQREQIEQLIMRRVQGLVLADELRQSSDDLTRFARAYAATSDATYKENFQTVLDIRDGKAKRPLGYEHAYWDMKIVGGLENVEQGEAKSLELRLREAGFQSDSAYTLHVAQEQSDVLAKIERDAFRLINDGYADEALKILYSNNYHRAKADIMEGIREFQKSTARQTANQLDEILKKAGQTNTIIFGLVLTSLLFGLLAGTRKWF